jgi:tetratricopeptide (TPR) repeat protein
MERWDNLVICSDSALTILPKDRDFLELKGIGLMQSKRIPESIEIFKELLSLAKGDSASTVRNLSILGDLYYQIGNKKECFSYYKKTLDKEPNHIATLNNYAYYLSLEGKNLKRAYEMSKKTIEAEPNNPTYLDTYAWILHLMNKDIEARAIFKHAMIYGGNESAAILDHYAEVLYSLKEYDLADIYWGQADKLDPSMGIAAKMAKKRGVVK